MEDIIKSINIGATDILGMMMPGTMVAVLLCNHDTFGAMIAPLLSFGGKETNVFALLVVGYVIGMLFHTVSDLVERCLWECWLLDPKFYAACKMNAEYEEKGSVLPKKVKDIRKIIAEGISSKGSGGKTKCALSILSCVWSSLKAAGAIYTTCHVVWIALFAKGAPHIAGILSIVFGFATFISSVFTFFPNAMHIRENTAWIQLYSSKTSNNSKISLFDSFRVMMRNLLWCLAALRITDLLPDFMARALNTSSGTKVYHIILIAIVLRYLQYAYLRYKYIYEDFFYALGNKDDEKPRLMNLQIEFKD